MRAVLFVLAITILLCPMSPAADRQLPPITEVFRIHSNLLESQRLIEQLQTTWGDDCDVPDTLEMWLETLNDNPPRPNWQIVTQISFAKTGSMILQSQFLPQEFPVLKESLADEDSVGQISSAGYIGIPQGLGVPKDDDATPAECIEAYGAQLRKTMQDIARHPVGDAVRFEVYPSNLNTTFARPKIQGLIASAHTYAQRGDGEDATEQAIRLAFIRTLTDLGQICLKDLDEVSLGLRRGERDQSVETHITLWAARRSELLAAFGEFGGLRNRCLSWLHPDHDGFLAVTLPIPEPLRDVVALSYVYGTLASVVEVLNSSVLIGVINRLAESARESQAFELLMQTIPCNDESSAFVILMPLHSGQAGSLTESFIQQAGFTKPVFDIDGHPCCRLEESLVPSGPHEYSVDVVETENCVAILIGTDAARFAFRSVVRRDFDECPKAARYLNSAIAADLPLSGEWPGRIFGLTDLWAGRKSDGPPNARMTASVQVNGDELSGQLHFEDDAALLGALLLDLVIEPLFDDAFEWLID